MFIFYSSRNSAGTPVAFFLLNACTISFFTKFSQRSQVLLLTAPPSLAVFFIQPSLPPLHLLLSLHI